MPTGFYDSKFRPTGTAYKNYLRNTRQWDEKPVEKTEESDEERRLRVVKRRKLWIDVLNNLK
jgi:hypothetical protein